jgi:hypothetical protein
VAAVVEQALLVLQAVAMEVLAVLEQHQVLLEHL